MAITRKFLKALGIEDEKIDQIIETHLETVNGLKNEVEQLKADAESLPAVKKELDEAKKKIESGEKDPYKVKYDAIKEEFETYKNAQTAKETKAAKTEAYRQLLRDAGVSEKRLEAVLRVSDVDGIELADGKVKDADKLTAQIKTDWADFLVSEHTKGADTANPPTDSAGTPDYDSMSDAEYYAAIAAAKKG